jgi:hypothetical protein
LMSPIEAVNWYLTGSELLGHENGRRLIVLSTHFVQ